MQILKGLLDFVLHLDKHLSPIIQEYGAWTYLLLFAIVFCETGLVVTPFLPGDSLLFAAGAFAANGSLSIWALIGHVPSSVYAELGLDVLDHGDNVAVAEQCRWNDVAA